SWIAFTLCILVTMASFQFSIQALRRSLPFAERYHLQNERDAFDKHLETFWCRAIDSCTWIASGLFLVGLVCTIIFAILNVVEVRNMPKKDETPHIVMTDFGKG